MNRDTITGLVLMGIAVIYYMAADALPTSMLSDEIGAQGYPKLLAICLFVLSAALVAQGIIAARRTRAEAGKGGDRHAARCAAVMVLIGVGYLAAIKWVGYPLAVGLLVAAVARFQGEPISKKLVITSVISAGFFWIFFVRLLQIPLPSGIWAGLMH
jgi:putative tricarboxylic transport membrane protein